jgi:uncharacterized protein (TIGR03435 family)
MRGYFRLSLLAFLSCASFEQGAAGQTFDVASVKVSQQQVGKDAEGQVIIGPASLSGRNVTLKSLIVEAYQLQPHQVIGGLGWLDSNEYDIEAKSGGPTTKEQLDLMLRALLADRLRLTAHSDTRELQVYELVADKNSPKVRPATDGINMEQLANLISIQLTIPAVGNDPSKPSVASGLPVPVLDETGLPGTYDIHVDRKLEPGADSFTLWQRFLQDRLGLKLESRKTKMEVLTVDGAEKTPTSN